MAATSRMSDGQTHEASAAELVKQLSEQTSRLARLEVQLAKAELAAKGKRAGLGVGMFGGVAGGDGQVGAAHAAEEAAEEALAHQLAGLVPGVVAGQRQLIEDNLAVDDSKPFVNGALIWALRDFRVRPDWDGGNPKPGSPFNQKGLEDQTGKPKPAYAAAARILHDAPPLAVGTSSRRN